MNQIDNKQLLENYLKEKGLYRDNMTNRDKLKALHKLSNSYSEAIYNADFFASNSSNHDSAAKWLYVASMNKNNLNQVHDYIKLIKKDEKQKSKKRLFGKK